MDLIWLWSVIVNVEEGSSTTETRSKKIPEKHEWHGTRKAHCPPFSFQRWVPVLSSVRRRGHRKGRFGCPGRLTSCRHTVQWYVPSESKFYDFTSFIYVFYVVVKNNISLSWQKRVFCGNLWHVPDLTKGTSQLDCRRSPSGDGRKGRRLTHTERKCRRNRL